MAPISPPNYVKESIMQLTALAASGLLNLKKGYIYDGVTWNTLGLMVSFNLLYNIQKKTTSEIHVPALIFSGVPGSRALVQPSGSTTAGAHEPTYIQIYCTGPEK